ncbi:putative glycolipid-binding domain-containing protein [Parapedobacter sp. DT-150]|uniref:putative glycolipid-binding domain-containing protein n=1 Tax=Parapedobacter sp. DT-150 TaxID=3396162 RepID=UPI003F1D894C
MNAQHVIWQGLYYRTMEHLIVQQHDTGYQIQGHIIGETKGHPLDMHYMILTDTAWTTQRVSVTVETEPVFVLDLHEEAFAACIDVDISMSPFTNTLTINRTKLPVGGSTDNTVLYVDIENRLHKPVRQRYTRVDHDWYRYENLESGFVSMVQCDENGFIIHYPGIWERIY